MSGDSLNEVRRMSNKTKTIGLAAVLLWSPARVSAQVDTKQVYEKVSPSVVFIKSDKGVGTGFTISANGTIVTALHVVDGAVRISIRMQSGDIYDDVFLLAQDERRDIAILKVSGFGLPTVALGNSNEVRPGDPICVIGNPLGAEELKTSISNGIVSGVRDLDSGYKTLQITAPVSPGNSGGPVLNASAEAVGVVVFRLKEGESLNFAIPINYVRGPLGSIDDSKPLKQWKRTEGTRDLFSDKETQRATRWRSVKTGAIYTLRFQGDYIYSEKEETEDLRKLGIYLTGEVKKNGDKYIGISHGNYVFWRTNVITGEKIIQQRCIFDFPLELTSVSSTRIEGRVVGPGQGAKISKRKCTYSPVPDWQEFTLIPAE
jgi:S1-C subfamily serine protease